MNPSKTDPRVLARPYERMLALVLSSWKVPANVPPSSKVPLTKKVTTSADATTGAIQNTAAAINTISAGAGGTAELRRSHEWALVLTCKTIERPSHQGQGTSYPYNLQRVRA